MSQSEFHRAYAAMPENFRAELIGGIVFEPAPSGLPHGEYDSRLGYLFEHYAAHTRGLRTARNASVIMSDEDEVQPDVLLRVLPEYGGQSKYTKTKVPMVKGAPELVAEIAHSSRAIDLHLKKKRYALTGVKEYVVVCLEPARVYWFNLQADRELKAVNKIVKSKVFPGLWIDVEALLEFDYEASMSALNEGLASRQHADFVAKLARAYLAP